MLALIVLCNGFVVPARFALQRVEPLAVYMGGDAYGASGTSFYTTTEKQESYDSLDTVLAAKCRGPKTLVVPTAR